MAADAAARAAELSDAAVGGDRLALARLLTAVENRTPVAEAALRRLYPTAGRAHLVGITGPPGSGKSTLVAALIAEVRKAGRSVAVIAVDPSSPITGGALLGDRVRMQAYAGDGDVFIRSMASRGHAGGLAATSTAAAAVLDAAGFDLILIETVGTGQSEVEVAAAADTTVVLEAPEMGDEVQAIKAGLLEVADLVVVNKGDKPGAQRTAAQLRAMLVASAPRGGDDSPAAAQAPRGPDHDRRDRRGRAGAAGRARPASRGRAGGRVVGAHASPVPRRRSGRSSPTACASASTTPTHAAVHRGHPRGGRRTPPGSVRGGRPAARARVERPATAAPDRPRPSLITRPFVSLAAAALAFYIAGGIILPITPRFVEERLAGGTLAVGHRVRLLRDRVARPRARSSAGRRTDSGAGRCSSAAPC